MCALSLSLSPVLRYRSQMCCALLPHRLSPPTTTTTKHTHTRTHIHTRTVPSSAVIGLSVLLVRVSMLPSRSWPQRAGACSPSGRAIVQSSAAAEQSCAVMWVPAGLQVTVVASCTVLHCQNLRGTGLCLQRMACHCSFAMPEWLFSML